MQFKEGYFRFNGINSKDKNLKIINVDNFNNKRIFGVEQEIKEDDNGTDVPLFLSTKRKVATIPITIMKMTKKNKPIHYAQDELEEICKWLIKREYKPFISWDNTGIVYYAMFTKGSNFENAAGEGYINLDMRLNAPQGYTNQLIDSFIIKDQKIINVYSKSNVSDFIYPDIQFELLNNNTNVEIINKTTNQIVKFTDLEPNEEVYLYNDNLKDVKSITNPKRNIFENFNKQWLRLHYGKNVLLIKGNCKIRFIQQYPVPFI